MVYSQIEMASSPYARILKDHNGPRDRERESNPRAQVAFQKNFKVLGGDHLHTFIDENSQYPFDNRGCCAGNEERNQHKFRLVNSRKENRVEFSALRRRQSRILDRWAAQQAQEMITNIERQEHKSELLALSNSQTVSTRASTFLRRESSPTQSDSSADLLNLQASSSIVQKWREFEAEAKIARENWSGSVNSNSNSVSCRINSTISNIENASVCNSTDERYEALAFPEDSFTDWESDQTAPGEPLSSFQGQCLDAREKQRVRVADIIRRLTSFSQTQSYSNEIDREQPIMTSAFVHGEQRDFPFIRNPPRIRGRQAVMDLLFQMEQERQRELRRLGELHAVSQFSQGRRIQSVLRLRLLQHKVSAQDEQHSASTISELDQLPQQSTIFLLRQRFSPQVELNGRSALSEEDNARSHTKLPTNTLEDSQQSIMSNHTIQDIHQQMLASFEQNHSTGEHQQEEAKGPWQGTSLKVSNIDFQGPLNTATTSQAWDRDEITEEPDPSTLHPVELAGETWLSDVSSSQRDEKSHTQAWYHEMLENTSDNEEIRELLQRRSVSNTLASGFRERMEQLILSNLQRQRHQAIVKSAEEEKDNPNQFPYLEVRDDSDQVASASFQLPLPSQLRLWNRYEDHELSDSDQVDSTSSQFTRPSQSYFQDTQQCSPFIIHSSLETELIYDLRGHMARLHQEMSELRKAIDSCMGLQVKLQKSIKQEVAAAVSHSFQRGGEEMEFFNFGRVPMRQGNCRICYEKQVDSLLYRCGHMCTCFKCAHELQWSSGRCPICQDPIVDVVRAYSDSYSNAE